MILIRVDLPAPLSPNSPRTSPLRRCRLTSRNAVTGPKRFAMCSTRMTSSGAEVGPTTVSIGTACSAKTGPRAYTRDICVDHHRQNDREAKVERQIVGVDALEHQPVVEDAEEQGADQRPHHRP